ncbi:MAG: AraC family transcriptional regulator [Vicinamibacterales bacterium]
MSTKTGVDARVTWAVAEMHRRMAEPLTIESLAAAVNLSGSRFRQLFLAQTGSPPQPYLQRLRLRRARLLIERTFLSVKEVMALVGYNDPSHFSRDFRRCHGVPPSALRGRDPATPLPSPAAVRYAPETAQLSKPPTHKRIRQKRARVPSARCA